MFKYVLFLGFKYLLEILLFFSNLALMSMAFQQVSMSSCIRHAYSETTLIFCFIIEV